MSQQLLEQKQSTFEQIVPLWFEYLTTGLRVEYLSIMSRKYCIVGEAHRFDDRYRCNECQNFSNEFVEVFQQMQWTKEELESDIIVKEFVKHWSEKH